MNNVYDAVCQRRTIRRFQDKSISREILLKLVNAARLAPSGANIQPCEYIIVDDPQLVDALFRNLKWAGYIAPQGDPPEGERPVAYIVVLINLHRKKKKGEVDAAAGIENILITAWEEGVGSCWLGSIHRKQIKTLLRIPHHLKVDSVVALGYMNEKPVLEDTEDSIKYWKDEHNVLHVPKRRMDDIVHENGYGENGQMRGAESGKREYKRG